MTWLGANVIETASGRAYDFVNPDPDVICIEDIAHALSNICRFAGHTRTFYSVAEHSVLVSNIIEAVGGAPRYVLAGFLHDAHEAYVWDAPRPIKPLLGEAFAALADTADLAIAAHFQVSVDSFHSSVVKAADNVALKAEGSALMAVGPKYDDLSDIPAIPTNVPFYAGVAPKTAKRHFLDKAAELGLR